MFACPNLFKVGLKDCSVFTGIKKVVQNNPLVLNGSPLWHFLHTEGTLSILDDLVDDLVPSTRLEMLLIQNLYKLALSRIKLKSIPVYLMSVAFGTLWAEDRVEQCNARWTRGHWRRRRLGRRL